MEHADLILQHSLIDDYIVHILSEWQLDKDNSQARANLLMKAQSFPGLAFLAAACFLKIGDLYAMDGDAQRARSAYLKVADETAYVMRRYQRLADYRLHALKEPSGQSTTAAMIGSYRGTASLEIQGIQRRIPVALAIESERGEMFTGYLTIQAATLVKVPIHGKARQGDITAAGSLPDRSLTISLRAKQTGKHIAGQYTLSIPNYRQYQLSSPAASGEFTVSR